jgi:actin-related protein
LDFMERIPPILILESMNLDSSSQSKREFINWMFEKMEVSVMGLASQVLMDLFATGLTSGIVVDSGHGHTQIAPIIEGYILKHFQISENISGIEFNKRIQSVLQKNNFLITNKPEFYDSFKKKSKGVYFKDDVEKLEYDLYYFPDKSFSKKYTLPDGKEIDMGFLSVFYNYQFFNPHLKGSPSKSLPYLINKTIKMYNEKIHKIFTKNIVICGGNSKILHLKDMIVKEINKSEYLNDHCWNVDYNYKPEYLAWRGGAIVTQLPNCNAFWITKSEFEEEGSLRLLKRKLGNAPNFL